MEIPFEHNKFESQRISIQPAGWFSGVKLLVNGSEAKRKKGKFIIRSDSGEEVTVQLKSNFIDPIPKVIIDEQEILLAKPLQWFEYLWMGLPIILVFVGGALGGVVGFSACYSSARLFRSDKSILSKYVLTGFITLAAVIIYFILAIIFQILVGAA